MDAFKSVIREFKVLRDIWQFSYIALYSVIDYMKNEVKIALSIIPNIITLNLPNQVYESISIIIIVAVILVAILLVVVGLRIEPRMKLLLDSPSWVSIPEFKRKVIRISLLVYTTELQSVNNAILSFMFFTKSSDTNSSKCAETPGGFIQFLGVLIVLLLDFIMMFILFFRIKRDKPSIKGKLKNYNNQKYSMDLETLQTPYKSLFEEYSYKMAYYEILIMLIKIFSIFLMVGVSLNNQDCNMNSDVKTVKGSVAIMNANLILLILEVFKFAIYYFSRPYLNLSSNRRMAFGSLMNAILYFININITWPTTNNDSTKQLGVGLTVNFWICNFFIGLIWIFTGESKIQGRSGAANIYKKLTGKLDLTPLTLRNIDDKASDVIENYVLFNEPTLDFEREKRLIFWQPWWDQFFEDFAKMKDSKKSGCCSCFSNLQNIQTTDQKLSISSYDVLYLPNCAPVFRPKMPLNKQINKNTSLHTLHERFVENSLLLNYLDNNDYQRALIMYTNQALMIEKIISMVGPDAVYKGKFHQLSVVPFPFTVTLIEDSKPKETIVIDFMQQDVMEKLIVERFKNETKNRKEVRRKIRCLEGKMVVWPFKEDKRVFNYKKKDFELITFEFVEATLVLKRATDCLPIYGPEKFNVGPGFSCHLNYKKVFVQDSSGTKHNLTKTLQGHDFGMTVNFAEFV